MLLQCKDKKKVAQIAMIVAIDRNGAIGKNGDQLIYISADLKHFKATTSGHTVVMGRKTSEALPKGILPNRRNIIITRSQAWSRDGAEVAHSVAETINMTTENEQIFVIGGGEIYKQFMPISNKLFVTEIDMEATNPDTFFPTIETSQWNKISTSEWLVDEKTNIRFRFVEYVRCQTQRVTTHNS